MNDHKIDSNRPAETWEDGYALGCGRIGAVTSGDPWADRFALNHDLLWRRYLKSGCADHRNVIPEFRRLWFSGERAQAVRSLKNVYPCPADMIYINPLVPACDLTMKLTHSDDAEVSEYRRVLDMREGTASVSFLSNGKRYFRESFCSAEYGVLVNRLTVSPASSMSAEVILSRFPDHDCHVEGRAARDEIVLSGEFEEGVRFASVTKLLHQGGRTTCGRKSYASDEEQLPPCLNGFLGTGWRNVEQESFDGPSACIDSAQEILILTAIVTSDETDDDLTEACRRKINAAPRDYAVLKQNHIAAHSALFDRVSLDLNGESDMPVSELVSKKEKTTSEMLKLAQLQFDMARYLAVSGAMPAPIGAFPHSPMGLQGIWNQEGRPLWDADYHMDLNLQMTYWGMNRLNLGEAMEPVLDWMLRMLPQARNIAEKQYGCRGACFACVADAFTLGGNYDYFGPGFVGAGPWLLQILWQHYDYTNDQRFLEKLYPVMYETAEFFESYLIERPDGTLAVCPSPSPEMRIWLDDEDSVVSEDSSFDLELIHELMKNLMAADAILDKHDEKIPVWQKIDRLLPWPAVGKDGDLMEWREPHLLVEEGHRHRSHLVGLCPGNRINREETPELVAAARKALEIRQSYTSDFYYPSFSPVWDAQLLNRMGDGEAAWAQIRILLSDYPCAGLLLSHRKLCAPAGGWFEDRRLFQIEANMGVGTAISEFFVQDCGSILHILPALPADMKSGSVSGLRTRGGFEVSVTWRDGQIVSAEILSTLGGVCRWKAQADETVYTVDTKPGERVKLI